MAIANIAIPNLLNMKIVFIVLTIILFASCIKDEKPEKRAVFYEVAGPSAYEVKYINDLNQTITIDTVVTGWNKNQWVEVGSFAGIEARKIFDTTIYSVDFLRMYIAGKKFETIDSGYSNKMSLWHKVN